MNVELPKHPSRSISRRSVSEKKRLLQVWGQSSLKMKEFCSENNISLLALKYWMTQSNIGRKQKVQTSSSSRSISLIPQVPAVTATSFAEYILANNSRLVINQMADASFLKKLISSSR
jgi:hypothetical protein